MAISRKVLVIGNYSDDNQQSMNRFGALLFAIYQSTSSVTYVSPPVIFGRIAFMPGILRKYLAYIDKLLLFPLRLLFIKKNFNIYHIIDHGNAYYSFFLNPAKTIITCHDLLAVRGARGDIQVACPASPLGPWLQYLIMEGLRRSRRLTFVSKATYIDYQKIGIYPESQLHKVIPNCLNASFSPDPKSIPKDMLDYKKVPKLPYLLMVGSALPRKNRLLGLKLLEHLRDLSNYQLVFAGDPLTKDESSFISANFLEGRIHSIVRPSHSLLNMLYCYSHALIFPSLSEGFGWPLIEAQACGCPVIASNTTSIPEVVGAAGLLADPNDVVAFANHVNTLEILDERRKFKEYGFHNIKRFSVNTVTSAYQQFAFSE
jgi:glycosyltransferase involved in cell wall biosynthesis